MPNLWTTFRQNYQSWRIAAFAAAIFIALSADTRAEIEEAFLVVEGAQNVREHHFDPSYWQIAYTLDVEFPWLAIDEPQRLQLEQAGWVQCHDARPGWDSFTDVSRDPHRIIHQHIPYWSKGDRMITIAMRYDSTVRGDSRDEVPDNTQQRVFLLFDEEVKVHRKIERLGLDCP